MGIEYIYSGVSTYNGSGSGLGFRAAVSHMVRFRVRVTGVQSHMVRFRVRVRVN